MAEGWKQIIDDLRGALGLPKRVRTESNGQANASDAEATADVVLGPENALVEAREPARDAEGIPSAQIDAVVIVESDTTAEAQAFTPRRKLSSYAGLGAALLAAVGIGWYVYFGGPQPPVPNVVATFEGGQITVEQVHEHATRLGLDPLVHATGQISNTTVPAVVVYDTYRATVEHMVSDELVRRWAANSNWIAMPSSPMRCGMPPSRLRWTIGSPRSIKVR